MIRELSEDLKLLLFLTAIWGVITGVLVLGSLSEPCDAPCSVSDIVFPQEQAYLREHPLDYTLPWILLTGGIGANWVLYWWFRL